MFSSVKWRPICECRGLESSSVPGMRWESFLLVSNLSLTDSEGTSTVPVTLFNETAMGE